MSSNYNHVLPTWRCPRFNPPQADLRKTLIMNPNSVARKKCALVVDDDADIVEFVSKVVRARGYEVRCAYDGDEALVLAKRFPPDVMFLDINLPNQDGWLVCNKLKLQTPSMQIVLITGETREDLYRFASFVCADDLIKKPFRASQIERTLDQLNEAKQASA